MRKKNVIAIPKIKTMKVFKAKIKPDKKNPKRIKFLPLTIYNKFLQIIFRESNKLISMNNVLNQILITRNRNNQRNQEENVT